MASRWLSVGAVVAATCVIFIILDTSALDFNKKDIVPIAIEPIIVGNVSPLSTINSVVVIKNLSDEYVNLDPPRATCGCLLVAKEPLHIGPGSSIELPFELHAPGSQGPFERSILLRKSSSRDEWVVSISGSVSGDIWLASDGVKLVDRAGKAYGHLIVSRRAGLAPPSFVVSDGLAMKHRSEDANSTSIEVERESLFSDDSTCGFIDVFGPGGDLAIHVPVICEVRTAIRTIPEVLTLGRIKYAKEPSNRRIILQVDAPLTIDGVDIQPLQKWVTLTVNKKKGSRVAEINVMLDVERIPEQVDNNIIRISGPEGEPVCIVRAVP